MNTVKGILFAAISSVTFGFTPFFSVWLMDAGLSPLEVLTYRWGVASLSLFVFGLCTGADFRVSGKDVPVTLGLTLLRALTSFSLIIAYANIASGTAAIIHFMYPLAVALGMLVFFGERQPWVFFVALLLSTFGAYLLSHNGEPASGRFWLGTGAACVSVLAYAGYMVGVQKTRASRIEPTVLTTYVMLAGAVLFFIGGMCSGGVRWITSGTQWLAVLGLAIPATALSNFALVRAIRYIGSGRTAAFGALEPLTAIVIGVSVLHEPFTWQSGAGIVLIVVSVSLVVWLQRRG